MANENNIVHILKYSKFVIKSVTEEDTHSTTINKNFNIRDKQNKDGNNNNSKDNSELYKSTNISFDQISQSIGDIAEHINREVKKSGWVGDATTERQEKLQLILNLADIYTSSTTDVEGIKNVVTQKHLLKRILENKV
ncbi:hypothetical protein PIROE2DRAFT_18186 [Piromyces sp. E2]|nr:hypothetical protein PIROE2DRAFT_18186 [Piromyces sp. E2]|eukprot:OUM56976.1 hypothetical protein PIROE2DRAFT_18186 [Piromyces sp. E2]